MTPRQLCAAFIENSAAPPDHFDPAALLEPAWAEFGQRLGQLPGRLTARRCVTCSVAARCLARWSAWGCCPTACVE